MILESATALARLACKGVLSHFVLSHLVTLVNFFDFWSFRGSRICGAPTASNASPPPGAPKTLKKSLLSVPGPVKINIFHSRSSQNLEKSIFGTL